MVDKVKLKSRVKSLLPILLGLIVGYIISNVFLCVAVVEGVSMYPTYSDGNYLIINKLAEPHKGDIVVFEKGGENLIKRVIAEPGDNIRIDNSILYVNGREIDEKYINEKNFEGGIAENTQIDLYEGQYFCMGDNRNNSFDSREFGLVSIDDVVGVKLVDLWR